MCMFWQVLAVMRKQAYSVEQHDIKEAVRTVIFLNPQVWIHLGITPFRPLWTLMTPYY